jgi:hypothetical protein
MSSKVENKAVYTIDTFTKEIVDVGKMEMNVQYFPSVRQLRIGMISICGLQMDLSEIFVQVSLFSSKMKMLESCVLKKTTIESNTIFFKRDAHLHTKNEKFDKCYLGIKICKPKGRMRRRQTLANSLLHLHGHALVLDTTFHTEVSGNLYFTEHMYQYCMILEFINIV